MLLLPITLLFVGAAVAASLTEAQAAGGAPVAQAAEAETCVEIPIELTLHASDAENDIVLYQLTEQPCLGTAKIEGSTLTYSPGSKTGKDRFSFTAVDADGNPEVLLSGSGSASFAVCESMNAAYSLVSAAKLQGWWARSCSFASIGARVVDAPGGTRTNLGAVHKSW